MRVLLPTTPPVGFAAWLGLLQQDSPASADGQRRRGTRRCGEYRRSSVDGAWLMRTGFDVIVLRAAGIRHRVLVASLDLLATSWYLAEFCGPERADRRRWRSTAGCDRLLRIGNGRSRRSSTSTAGCATWRAPAPPEFEAASRPSVSGFFVDQRERERGGPTPPAPRCSMKPSPRRRS